MLEHISDLASPLVSSRAQHMTQLLGVAVNAVNVEHGRLDPHHVFIDKTPDLMPFFATTAKNSSGGFIQLWSYLHKSLSHMLVSNIIVKPFSCMRQRSQSQQCEDKDHQH